MERSLRLLHILSDGRFHSGQALGEVLGVSRAAVWHHLKKLQDLGNSLIVVEHDYSIIKEADWIIDMGPGAGEEGGEIVFQGPYSKRLKSKCLTSHYFLNKKTKASIKKGKLRGPGRRTGYV